MNLGPDDKAPLVEHLVELRNRLLYSVLAILVAFLVCYGFAEEIYDFLLQPLRQAQPADSFHMYFTGLAEPFFTYMKVAFLAGLFIALPVVLNQIWLFIAPGLYPGEKKVILPYLFVGPILFFLGGSLTYFLVLPLAAKFFLSFATPEIQPLLAIKEYLSLVTALIFAFGLAFQLPIILLLLVQVGAITTQTLVDKRKYAIVAAFVIGAILTPPDAITQVMLAIPLLLLYEISILWGRVIEKRRKEVPVEPDTSDDSSEEGEAP